MKPGHEIFTHALGLELFPLRGIVPTAVSGGISGFAGAVCGGWFCHGVILFGKKTRRSNSRDRSHLISERGTFRDMETQKLQRDIKNLLKRMNWSQSEAAKRIYCEKNDIDNEEEIYRFIERFKKHVSRKTTNPSVLSSYYDILCMQREVVACEGVSLRYVYGNTLDSMILRDIVSISREISEDLKSSADE